MFFVKYGKNKSFNKNEDLRIFVNSGNFEYQTITASNRKHNMIMNEVKSNSNFNNINNINNVNVLDNYDNSEDKHNSDLSSNSKKLNNIVLDRSDSFEKLPENNYIKIRNKHKDLSLTHHEIKKKKEKNDFETYFNTTNRELRKNNYSISNIANIKIKKVILPEYVRKRNINRESNSLLSENKGTILISNDLSSTNPQKSMYLNDSSNNMRKTVYNISTLDKHNIRKHKNINMIHSAKTINKKFEIKKPEKINSLMIIKPQLKNNNVNNLYYFKKGKKYNLSFDKEKNSKDEQIQIGFRKTFYLKNKIKEQILINSKNFKKSRKIKI